MRVSSTGRPSRVTVWPAGSSSRPAWRSFSLDRAAAAAQQRAQPRAQLLERERLDQVVVGAGVEAVDAVRDGVARGQHQHRRAVAGGAQPAADLEPVGLGHQHVEHDRVRRLVGERVERLAAVGGELDPVAVHAQRAIERVADRGLVVHHEDAHIRNPLGLTENVVRG